MTEFIPFNDLKKNYMSIKSEIDKSIQNVIDNGYFILGPEVESFESNFSSYLNVKYCAGVSSGTSAIELALKALNIGHEDEVITTAHTWVSTAEAISNVNAKPVFVDIDESSFNINPSLIEDKITKKTKAILPVHLYGNPADMKKILKIAKKHNLRVIEDSAQAHGSMINKNFCGSFGDIACFSFYPGKNLGAFGDAGAVVSNNKVLIDKVKQLRDHGRGSTKNEYDLLGTNDRLDGLQAAVLNVKLQYLNEWILKRNNLANIYDNKLKNYVIVPSTLTGHFHSYHLYVIKTQKRDKLFTELKKKNVDVRIHYPIPVHKQKIYFSQNKNLTLPITEKTVKEIITIPIFPEMTEKQVNTVCKIIINCL